ncbi:MAG TPA: L-type lectin-domain containing protein, partial [Candidatus Dormibacteraeota bacterium]|nr:L-type lectin-domain containing protein [Candidatus Dormibacteraeota bacterium]
MATKGSIRFAALAALSLMSGLSLASAQCPTSPSYSPDFTANQNCLSLNGTNSTQTGSPSFTAPATPQASVSKVLRLTANQGGWATSAWYGNPQVVTNGFSTTFAFQLGSTSTFNADGFAFVIQNSAAGPLALGPPGCGIGFGGSTICPSGNGIPNSVAIEFNTFNNGAGIDPSADDVTIQNCGTGQNRVDAAGSLGHNDLTGKINLTDGAVHVATVTYKAVSNCGAGATQTCSTLDVVLDGTDLFPGGVHFDMSTIGLTGSTALVGFTAATGGGNDDQDIVRWTFNPAGQSDTGNITPGQTTPTAFPFNGGFDEGSPTTGYTVTVQQTTSAQTLNMVVTAIPISQAACSALVNKNPLFAGAQCFVFQNGGGQDNNTSVLFEVTCPASGSCGSTGNPFYADL